jgi:hypothetical protein
MPLAPPENQGLDCFHWLHPVEICGCFDYGNCLFIDELPKQILWDGAILELLLL